MRKQLIDPPQLHDGSPFGMSQAAILVPRGYANDTASATVYISGQIDWDVNNQVSCHTVEGQLSKALTNLTTVLEASGSSVEFLTPTSYLTRHCDGRTKGMSKVIAQRMR
jgi:2-iminobutanoate/2-iminopropanoate deaminase